MYSRWTALAGLAVVLASHTAGAADEQPLPLADADFQDWKGVRIETTLGGHSIISEYVARSRSSDSKDGLLEMVFIPRFGCTPLLRVILPEQEARPPSGQGQLTLTIDGEVLKVPVLIDGDGSSLEYSFMGTQAKQQEMRLLLDRSSHLLVTRTNGDEGQVVATDTQPAEPLKFSLLGSRLSVESVESHCQMHTPLPFALSESE